MIYPEFLKIGDTIGVTAPSDGITDPLKINRLNNAITKMKEQGFNIVETKNVRTSIKGKSTDSKSQASELASLYLNPDVSAIICAAGGDFLLEMLSYTNFANIKKNIKWIQGHSDPTALLFTITTNLDIATIYSCNFGTFGMNKWHKSLLDNIAILKGNIIIQSSFPKYESYKEYETGLESYNLTEDVKWENLDNEKEITMKGRIIGGCIDVISELFGTKYDKTLKFIEKYKNDGIIWYFDNCEQTSEELIRTLWRFKEQGYFNYCKGIIFGRSATESSYYNISYKDAIKYSFKDLNIPIIINADIGHISPKITIINGAIASIACKNNKGSVTFELK